jgi:hypothetical protein
MKKRKQVKPKRQNLQHNNDFRCKNEKKKRQTTNENESEVQQNINLQNHEIQKKNDEPASPSPYSAMESVSLSGGTLASLVSDPLLCVRLPPTLIAQANRTVSRWTQRANKRHFLRL